MLAGRQVWRARPGARECRRAGAMAGREEHGYTLEVTCPLRNLRRASLLAFSDHHWLLLSLKAFKAPLVHVIYLILTYPQSTPPRQVL